MGNANLHTVDIGSDLLPNELRVGLSDSVDQGTHRSLRFVHALDGQVATGI